MKCSKCGRKVIAAAVVVCDECRVEPNNKPLTLDELRGMTVEPVYIVSNDISWWEIVNWVSEDYFHGRIGTELPLDSFGKTWLAYRCKPEQCG